MSQEKAVSEKEGVKAGSVKKEGAGPVPAALKSGKAKKRTGIPRRFFAVKALTAASE